MTVHNRCMKNILSIRPAVAYGGVGDYPLQRLGHEVWPVHTANLSNPTSYGAWRGPIIPAEDVREVIAGINDRGALKDVDVVLSGDIGSDLVDVVVDTVAQVKELNPDAVYCCGALTDTKLAAVADVVAVSMEELESALGPSTILAMSENEMIAVVGEKKWSAPLKHAREVAFALFVGHYVESWDASVALEKMQFEVEAL